MQLHIHIQLNRPVSLPINYNHILQGVIYNAVFANYPNYADELHDEGGKFGKRTYKAFTFGPLFGAYRIKDKRIIFHEDISWEIRSTDSVLITILRLYFESHGINFLSHRFRHIDVSVNDYTVEEGKVQIAALSPILAYSTLDDSGITHYYTPEERGFYELTKLNAYRRYDAIMKAAPGDIEFRPLSIRRSDKVVTRYRGIMITGWRGRYELEGDPHLIDFLYQTGLGSKNSQGFGMFEILDSAGSNSTQ